ncbi:expressed unknown protein [Seminavis robusta]|uniref:Disease resistance R13L4/SHOC-2-like LRR domain-containing protein n=1 Tax=Seminavis robusta TaxID=568900 RepID=A0A9N8H8D1_9STRA|nr:expressed unknown protein [Seminavis robusta]|eukprot:Sro213_g088550.2  (701) ;mRNA; r:69220-71464
MSDNSNNNVNGSDNDDVDLLKIVEWRLRQGSAESGEEEEETAAASDAPSSYFASSATSSPAATGAAPPPPTSATTSVNHKGCQVPQQTILSRQTEYSRQQQRNPGAYAVGGPCLANFRENHSNSHAGTSEEGLDNWVEEIGDDKIIAHPIDDDQQTGLLPNAEPVPSNARSRAYWRQKLICSLSAEIIVAFLILSIVVLIFVVTSKQGNRNRLPNQIGSSRLPANPVEAATTQTFLESLNLPQYTQKALANSRSPQSKAYQWLVNNINNQTLAQPDLPKWRLIQRFSMATFYYSTRGDYWVKHRGWLDWETNECSWEQLFMDDTFSPDLCCNEMGEIKALAFWQANNMEGTIPPEISLLGKSLQSIEIIRQLGLKGTIPTVVGLLTQLTRLLLSVVNIDGSFPTELGQLQSLQLLQFHRTPIQGHIPSEIGRLRNLSTVIVGRANITGSVPIDLYKLPGLQSLLILNCPGLETEYILQEIISNTRQLRFLMLSSQSVGTVLSIPSEIGTLTELTLLHLQDWNFHGTLPGEIGKLSKLTHLHLGGNSISGTLPPILLEFTNLVFLHLGSNKLEGTIPPNLLSILTNLQALHLNDNLLVGTIPTEVGQLSDLRQIELQQNTNLSGTLPRTELLSLKKLTNLVVTETSLSGSIPEELCDRMHHQEKQCYGSLLCAVVPVNSSTTVCQGTFLCGCADCAPCELD